MASQVKGVSIDISADTSKFQKALRQLDAPIKNINNELKDLNYALKLDPKNVQLMAQKQEVLGRKIAESREKLKVLLATQKEFGDYASLTDEQKEKYNQLSVEIAKTEKSIADMNKEMLKTHGIDFEKLKDGLKKVGEVALDVSKKLLQVTGAISGALASVVGLGVKSYASLEQNVGGINKIFEDSADKVIANSKKAYKEAGMSANQYMETATSFSASLLKGLGGDTEKAAELTDRAIKDMSDNANTFGASVDDIANVYKALSKEQFTTLDNLRLGYAGTKAGMQQLIKDASSYKEEQKELGITVDESSMSFDNMIKAISVVQKHLNITGTTMNEAEHTISGSIGTMKSAFDNFLNGSGSPEALSESITNVLINIGEAITKLAPSILSGIVTLIQNLIPQIATILFQMIPQLLTAVQNMIATLCTMITSNTTQIATTVTTILNQVIMFITNNLPLIIDAGIKILLALVDGIVGAIPTLAEALPQLITTILNVLVENIPAVLEGAIQLLMALVEAIPVIIQALVDNLPSIIDTIITTLIDNLPMLLQASIQLFMALVQAIPQVIIQLVKVTPTIITSIVKSLWNNRGKILESGKQILLNLKDGIINNLSTLMNKVKEIPTKLKEWLISGITKIKDAGKDLINGMWDGIQEKWDALKDKVKKFGEGVVGKFKKVFGISSPSKVFKEEIGQWLGYGIEEGFVDTMDQVSKNMTNSIPIDSLVQDVNGAMSSLNHGIQTSINPNINPNITYDMNYQMMAKAMKDAMSNMEIALDDREVGKFVTKTITDEIYGGNL